MVNVGFHNRGVDPNGLTGFDLAGPGNKVLVDQNGEVVFYSNHLNKIYWDFVVKKKLYDLATLQAIRQPGPNFPTGALELKVSWRMDEKNGKILVPNAEKRFYPRLRSRRSRARPMSSWRRTKPGGDSPLEPPASMRGLRPRAGFKPALPA